MDTKEEDRSEESKKNHIVYYKSLTRVISDIKIEKNQEEDITIKNHLDKRIDAMEKDRKSIREMFPEITEEEWNGTPTEKNHNKHLDLLQEYKTHLIKYIQELEKLDKQSEFAKRWNETTIKERKQELQIINKILKNLIRF
ncbi:MAG: hypothetical protein ACE5GR_00475 [Nitrosopumilus sp.]